MSDSYKMYHVTAVRSSDYQPYRYVTFYPEVAEVVYRKWQRSPSFLRSSVRMKAVDKAIMVQRPNKTFLDKLPKAERLAICLHRQQIKKGA